MLTISPFGRLLLAVVLLAFAGAVVPSEAYAKKPSKVERRTARQLNQEALEAYRAEDFLEAADKFRAAYALVKTPNVLYNLARALHRGGKPEQAKPYYEELVLQYPKFDAKKRARAYGYIKEIEAAAGERAEVARRRQQADTWRAEGDKLTAAGKHREAAAVYLRAHAAQPSGEWLLRAAEAYENAQDLKSARLHYELVTKFQGVSAASRARAEARLRSIDAQLKPATPPPTPKPDPVVTTRPPPPQPTPGPTRASGNSGLRTGGWAVLAVGVAALGVSLGLSVGAENGRSEARILIDEARLGDRPVNYRELTQREAVEAEQRGNDLALGSVIALGIGGAAVVTGLTMVLVAVTGSDSEGSGSVNVGAAPLPDGGAMLLNGRF